MQNDQAFLEQAGWTKAARYDFPADWSTRSFARLTRADDRSAILISSVPDSDPRALAGHKIKDFIILSKFLRSLSIHAPEIYAVDEAQGFLLVEDFGDYSLHHAFIDSLPSLLNHYSKAADILLTLREAGTADIPSTTLNYFETHIYKGRCRLWDWYIPAVYKQNMDDFKSECLKTLDEIEQSIPKAKNIFLHGDFHPHNLMILKNEDIGVLDFQGGMIGPVAYDVVNLLLDARRKVQDDIFEAIQVKMMAGLSKDEQDIYQAHFVLRSFDFHARVLGQAIKLALNGKDKLLGFVPLLEHYCRQDLAQPLLRPVQKIFETYKIDLSQKFRTSDILTAPNFIAKDAF